MMYIRNLHEITLIILIITEIWNPLRIEGLAIDNEISGIPEIQCSEEAVTFTVRTRNPFAGNVYIKGKFHDPSCRKEFFVNTANGASLAVRIPLCGMQRIRQLQPQGMNYILVFVVTFHPQFVTKVDRAYNVRCFYAQQEKTVSSSLEVSMLSTQSLEIGILIMPNCQYTVRLNTLNGPPVRYVRIGDRLVHRWECDNPNFGMLIKNCFVNDGYGSSVRVIDAKGCPVFTPVIQGSLQYDNNLNLAYVEVWAYKFPDRGDLFYQCQVQVCNKIENECVGLTPPNCPTNRPQPTPQPSSQPSSQPTPSNLIETQPPVLTIAYPQPSVDTTFVVRPDPFASYQGAPLGLDRASSIVTLPSAPANAERNWYPRGPEGPTVPPLEQIDRQVGRKVVGSPAYPPQHSRNQPPAIQLAFTVSDNDFFAKRSFVEDFVTPKLFTFNNAKKSFGRRDGRKKRHEFDDKLDKSDKTMDVASGVVYVAEVGDLNSDDSETSFPFGVQSTNEDKLYLICLTPLMLSVLLACFMMLAIVVLLLCIYLCTKSERLRMRWTSLTSLSSSPLY